jgi:geranylgeranyl diphosphate synthase type 3
LHCRIDDIQDNAILRRGVPATHTVYGVASSISAVMLVNFISLQRALISNQLEMIKLYTEMMLDMWRGQAIEVYWRENFICPSEEEYLEMVEISKDRVRALIRI